jgi:sulfur-oxidizing protein SoxA
MRQALAIAIVCLTFSTVVSPAPGIAGEKTVRSGSDYLSQSLKALQADDVANPGMLWVSDGENLWSQPAGPEQKSCASCHQEAKETMRGVAARYPAVSEATGELFNLEKRINNCRVEHQKAEAFEYESDELLALTTYVAHQSRGLPVQVKTDGAAAKYFEAGRKRFYQRVGQLNLSCAQCHEDNAGHHLRGDTISHGLGNGYPAYRLEWQTLGSLHRRLRACSFGVRAVQFDYGSPEYLSLELYLAKRAEGLPVETPAVRR